MKLTKIMNIDQHQYTAKNTGFTLIELVISIVITGIVTILAGSGLVAIVKANTESETKSISKFELNQALDLIHDELRMAATISRDSTLTPVGFTGLGTNPQPILVITPFDSNQPGITLTPIVYYLSDLSPQTPWKNPRAIYRWGPKLSLDGGYDPSIYEHQLIIDGISDRLPNPNPTCPSETDQSIPSNIERQGFYICLNPTEQNIKLWLTKLTDDQQEIIVKRHINYLNVL